MQTDCIILGGGASGLAAACALGQRGVRVALVERLSRVGKKLLSTGNGRCNLSNESMSAERYGNAAPFVRRVYEVTPPGEVAAFFSRLGLMTASEEGRVYPRTFAASSVLDVLRAGCALPHVTVLTEREALSLAPSRRGGLCVQLSGGEGLFAPCVLAAMGGSAAPKFGTDGSGVRLLSSVGHSATPLLPALVQLKCSHPALRSLKGIRTAAALTLEVDGLPAASETGELLFANYGVSGVCVFQLSGLAAKALRAGKSVCLRINFLPELPKSELSGWLDGRIARLSGADLQSLFTGVFPRLLSQAILNESRLSPQAPAAALTEDERSALLRAIGSLRLPVAGTLGFDHAQVTAGGVSLDEVDPETMRSRLVTGLYLAGELLDVDGPCGGYNLHFAFASALTAAKAIAASLNPSSM